MDESAEGSLGRSAWRQTLLVAVALLACPAVYVIMAVILLHVGFQPPEITIDRQVLSFLFPAALSVSVMLFLIAKMLQTKLLSPRYVTRHCDGVNSAARHYIRISMLCMGMAETAGVLGLVYFILTLDMLKLIVLVAMSVLFGMLVFPSRTKLEDLLQTVKDSGSDEQC